MLLNLLLLLVLLLLPLAKHLCACTNWKRIHSSLSEYQCVSIWLTNYTEKKNNIYNALNKLLFLFIITILLSLAGQGACSCLMP